MSLSPLFALEISPPHDDPFKTKAIITYVYSPFTMPVAVKVTLSQLPAGSNFPPEAILKGEDGSLDLLDDILDGDPYPVELTECVVALVTRQFFVNETAAIDTSTTDLDAICTAAVHIIYAYSDLHVLNNDVRLRNLILKPNNSEVVMIDLGHCCLRMEHENDRARKGAQNSEDEEGAVGIVGQRKYGWNYVPSGRFDIFVDTKGMKQIPSSIFRPRL
ncbi:hypothetical protein FRC11_008905 [Ceratobasidium sp. 423]|nr:hypothetical protein FRC11_008905 [Ceratobasidium sp. 423]